MQQTENRNGKWSRNAGKGKNLPNLVGNSRILWGRANILIYPLCYFWFFGFFLAFSRLFYPEHRHSLIENGLLSSEGAPPRVDYTFLFHFLPRSWVLCYMHTLIKCPQQKVSASKWNAGRGFGFKWPNLHAKLVKKFNLTVATYTSCSWAVPPWLLPFLGN